MLATREAAVRPAGMGSPAPTSGRIVRLTPSSIAVLLAALVLLLDLTLPGLPGSGLMGRLMAFMSAVCSQRPSHSYTIGDVQLPLEARMLGMFGGLLVGVIELGTHGRDRVDRWPRGLLFALLALAIGAMAFDGFNALFFDFGLPHLYAPDLRLRLATGTLAGLAMAFAIAPAVTLFERRSWRKREPLGPGWGDAGWTLLGAAGFAGLAASGWQPALYPVSLLAAGGVVAAVILLNRAVLGQAVELTLSPLAAARREWILQLIACVLAVVELATLAALNARFLLA
ncbi:MAG: DUF2085 domain-containing protein [Chloroflexota bacterium]